jgi:c-di-GMP-binding flagellar brake protein YcgR
LFSRCLKAKKYETNGFNETNGLFGERHVFLEGLLDYLLNSIERVLNVRENFKMVVEKGWLEQRRHERVSATVSVTYRVLNAAEKEGALQQPRYSETTADQLPRLAKKFHVYHAVTRDISEGGLSITGTHSFTVGEQLEIEIRPPQYSVPVTMLAEVKRSSSYSQMGKTFYTAGVSILALDGDSMSRLSRFLLSEKIRGDNEKSK